MSEPNAVPQAAGQELEEPDPRRWWGLVTIALAQLMVVLDITIVNIALPSAQRDLHMSNATRQWVITAYTLAFGGLLLLGGRIADRVGRRRTFMVGLCGFAVASAAGGAAVNSVMLFAARGLQGTFAALLAPSALSLLTTTFTDPRERSRAFGVYSALAGSGAAIGLMTGGLLTEYLDWRWCLFVNVPIGLLAVLGSLFLLRDRAGHSRGRLDLLGVTLGCGGLVALVYGFTEAETSAHGWASPLVLALLVGGALLLVLFGIAESRVRNPLLPLHIISERNRGGSFLAVALSTISLFGVFLFLTYYLQVDLRYTPLVTGLAFLPMTVVLIFAATQVSARLLPRVPPRWLMAPGLLIAASGMGVLTQLTVNGDYTSHILPALLLLGFGLGLVMMPAMSTATFGVAPADAGVTSATVNTSQQVGGSIGTALLNTIAISAAGTYAAAHPASARTPAARALLIERAQVHGYTVAIVWAMVVLLLAAVAAVTLVTGRGQRDTRQACGGPARPSTGTRAAGASADAPPGDGTSERRGPPVRLRGLVRRPGGTPVGEAVLTLVDSAGRQRDRTISTEDGHYALAAPDTGVYVLTATAEAYQPRETTVTLDDSLVDHDVLLGPG